MSAGDWCLIESDPGVFTELISDMGVPDVQVEEVFSLDEPLDMAPVHGLVFLFKYDQKATSDGEPLAVPPEGLFFAHQVINNACATQAILSVLMNADGVQLGKELSEFKSFVQEFPSDMKGLAISNSERIRSVHNSFARSDPFVRENSRSDDDEKEDLFHFVAYIPFRGKLYELDGLKQGPVCHGPCNESTVNWIDVAKPVIRKRIERYATQEIRFNLMAVGKSRLSVLRESIARNPSDLYASEALKDEEAKMARYHKENCRRRHNFVPLIFEMLSVLAKTESAEAKFSLDKQ